MLRKKGFWITVLVGVVLGGGGFAAYRLWLAPQQSTSEGTTTLETAVATIGDISVSASGSGVLVPSSTANLAFATSGTVEQLNVKVGDQVQEGEVLAQIDDTAAQQAVDQAEQSVMDAKVTAALSTSFDGALDVTSQLALGTLNLEGTADAVTEDEAAQLLPLWEALAGGALQDETERMAVVNQIERGMTEAQVSAIAVMALTQDDEQTWMQDQGFGAGGGFPADTGQGTLPSGGAPGGGVPARGGSFPSGGASGGAQSGTSSGDRTAMRDRFQNMTEEERAQLRAQFAQQGATGGYGNGTARFASGGVMRAVVNLLSERSGQTLQAPVGPGPQSPDAPAGDTEPQAGDKEPPENNNAMPASATADATATATPEPSSTPQPTVELTATPEPVTPSPTPTATAELSTQAENTSSEAIATTVVTATPADTAAVPVDAASSVVPVSQSVAEAETSANTADASDESAAVASVVEPALTQVPDTDPGPPFSVEISLNRATPNPLLDGSTVYKISGLLRNDGDRVYAVNTVHVTFFDASGFRGSYNPFPRRRYGEYIWHGALDADFDCLLLAPGEVCPFTAEIAAQDMGSFMVHADAVVAEWREPVPVTVRDTTLVDQDDTVRITGTIVNPNDYAIKNVVVNGVLLDGNGRITSMGSDYHVQTLAPGASASFTAMIPSDTYTTYQLYVQAEGDFK